MQKKLLAIAVGATVIAAPMFAQADVTLKGRLEVEVVGIDGGDQLDGTSTYNSVTSMGDQNGQSRWLIDASKDLGNGLKAIGRVAWSLDPADNQAQGNRDQYVGLAGGFGALVFGRLPTPYKMNGGVKWDPYTATFMQARQAGGMSGSNIGHNSFVNDVAAYIMPEIAGINATFAYVPSDDDGIGGTYTMGGTGKWGPVEVIAAYTSVNPDGADDIKQAKAGVRYKGNGLTAAWQFEDVDSSGPVNAYGGDYGTGFTSGSGKFNFFNLGYKFGNTLIAGNYGQFSGDTGVADVDYGALGVTYFFDKKVRVYGGYAMTDVKKVNSVAKDGIGQFDRWGAGIRYDF